MKALNNFFGNWVLKLKWDAGAYTGFEKDCSKFILQEYDRKDFAENFMLSICIRNAQEFWNDVNEKQLPCKFGIRSGKPMAQPYGKEVNIIDLAGVCWHLVEQ
ncbi:MAG: hypothetical protein ABIO55_15330 [Ginsengibacter sp.]